MAQTAPPAAAKWVSPIVALPGGATGQSTMYYGPWACRPELFQKCQGQCSVQGRAFMGCIWLADLRVETKGVPLPAYPGIVWMAQHQCCCDWPEVSPTKPARDLWRDVRETVREKWRKAYGEWPTNADGSSWDGHHKHDLGRGGHPTDPENIIPVPKDVHHEYTRRYKECYAGGGRWAQPGPEWPYAP